MKKLPYLNKIFSVFLGLAVICGFTGCASKKPGRESSPPAVETLADLQNFPQNLEVYADSHQPDKRLLSAAEQEKFARRFEELYFGPWEMNRTTVKKSDVAVFFKKARGYKSNGSIWTQPEWDAFAENADLAHYPSRNQSAITLRQTNLRELPTHEIRLDKLASLKDYPFDYFQYSLLHPGMPLLISHTSRDGKWHYVECPIASGWVDAADVGIVSEDFKRQYRRHEYAALLKDNVVIPFIGKAGIGTVLPLVSRNSNSLNVLVPVKRANHNVEIVETELQTESAAKQPFPMTPHNVALVGNQMLGQKYGWGGTLGDRDCSAMTRDLFAPFGIWLPRNSVVQARRGAVYSLEGLDAAAKKRAIIANGTPFLSLLGMKGHIGLYVGVWHGEPAMFHNVWGVRVVRDGNDNERFVIGKAVVTSIMPGKELKDLYLPVTFTDRLRSLATLGSSGN